MMRARARLLIVKTGEALPALVEVRGGYEDWIILGTGLARGDVHVVSVYEGEPLPEPDAFEGVVVTGSSAMVTDREPWSERPAAWAAQVVRAGTPYLGICYGHQLLAHGLGGRVERNPRGREIGTVEVRLTPEARSDALLAGFPAAPRFQVTHVESVTELPPGARLLAESDRDPHQAFALGRAAWGVQFHPEFDADIVRAYIAARRPDLLEEGLDPDALARSACDTPHGSALLRRFAELLPRV